MVNSFEIFVDPETKKIVTRKGDKLIAESGRTFDIINNIPNLTFPIILSKQDEDSRKFYEGRATQYDDTLHLTFFTHSLNEEEVRNSFIDKLHLKGDSKVLEIACGTGRDSLLIAKRLHTQGELHMQDISADMLEKCFAKLKDIPVKKSFCLSNACYLPYPDNYFDVVYSFGAIGEFSDKKMAIKEMVRVTKPGGKIVFGDEGIPPWHRPTEYFKILTATNPMFASEAPFNDLPVEARNVNVNWVIGGTFYLFDFEVGNGEPTANFDYEIPGVRGGTYRTRYEGQLEGVKPETKKLAYEARAKKGVSMHQWLEDVIREAAKKDLQ
jgi:ubiquinone/menaquinone biosynthesis C-methylase UbiE